MRSYRKGNNSYKLKGGDDEEYQEEYVGDMQNSNIQDSNIQDPNMQTANMQNANAQNANMQNANVQGMEQPIIPPQYTQEYPVESITSPLVSNRPTHETIQSGTFLYHPSQDIKQFSRSMIFVDVRNVLDKNQQRSFSMFFTPNEEYARRYSGLWSLNKRPVYVHKLQVSRPISGIKIFDASLIPDNMDNLEFSKNICGPSEDGTINGIKVTLPNRGEPIVEYYICNPETWFVPIETWMQHGPTEWIKISNDNKNSISVPTSYSNQQPVMNVAEQRVMSPCDDPNEDNENCTEVVDEDIDVDTYEDTYESQDE